MQQDIIFFSEAEAQRPRPAHLHQTVRNALKDKDLWAVMWPYLRGTAPTGSREFDHGIAVDRLLAWDAKHGGVIAGSNLSHRKLWTVIKRQLDHHFDVENGHINGLLEADNNGKQQADGDDGEQSDSDGDVQS